MTLYAVTHQGNPFNSIVGAYDHWDAARQYKNRLEGVTPWEVEDGDLVTIAPLVVIPAEGEIPATVGYGDDITLAWNGYDFTIKEEEE